MQWRTQDFEKGGGGGQKLQKIWEKHKSKFEIVTTQIRPIFSPKTGEEQKEKGLHSKFVPYFPQKQVKSKKKVFTQNLSHIFPKNRWKAKKKRSSLKFRPIFRPIISSFTQILGDFELRPDAQLAKGGGGMPQFCSLSHFSVQFWNPGDPKGGAMAQWPPP